MEHYELKEIAQMSQNIKKRILEECAISRVTFWNWKNGKVEIPILARQKIDEICKSELRKYKSINY